MRQKRLFPILLLALSLLFLTGCAADSQFAAPGLTLTVDPAGGPPQVSSGVQLLVLITVLSIAPSVLVLATSFTRIVIVMSLLRSAIGTPQIPPNQVLIGLSLLLTFFIMAPVYAEIDSQALKPYVAGDIEQSVAFERALHPIREFMFEQTRQKDLELFISMSGQTQRPETLDEISTITLLPAFVISELRAAFVMGFAIFVPFLIIDLVISSVLLSLGMMMLPPSLISLPFKLLLFVMVDGWYLIVRSLAQSFMG
jgi:flagellar biosynthetic protein FliP